MLISLNSLRWPVPGEPLNSIKYGGSVSLENVAGISEIPNLDGALVGGASLNAGDFINICRAFTV